MDSETRRSRPLPGHVALLLIFGGFTAWYVYDAWSASSRIENLILIAPVAVVIAICLATQVAGLALGSVAAALETKTRPPLDRSVLWLMAAFVAYVVSLMFVGFDVATFFFVLVSCWMLGERRPLVLVIYAAAVSVVCVVLFASIQPIPFERTIIVWP